MKISFTNPTSKRSMVSVWHNDEEHIMKAGDTIDLPVQKGDVVKYKVGRLSAMHTIDFQSPTAHFTIEANQKLQAAAFGVLVVALVIMYFMCLINNTVAVAAVVIVWLVGYEVALYSGSYRTKVTH